MHKLPELPYSYDALDPYIDERTMELHHTKHHAAYISNLNAALDATGDAALKEMDIGQLLRNLSEVPEAQRIAVRNNGGGHYNHDFFWKTIGPGRGGEPTGAFKDAIKQTFDSFKQFQAEFEKTALARFGSGWAWLYVSSGQLKITSSPNQDNPIIEAKGVPVFGIDVWEHAYYLQYQNRRAEYVKALWNVVNWDEVASRYARALHR